MGSCASHSPPPYDAPVVYPHKSRLKRALAVLADPVPNAALWNESYTLAANTIAYSHGALPRQVESVGAQVGLVAVFAAAALYQLRQGQIKSLSAFVCRHPQ